MMNETSGQEKARWADERASEAYANLKADLSRKIGISVDCGHWDNAMSAAKVLAILLASERN